MSITDVLQRKGPRKLLALDGGGIMGVISLGFLIRLEAELRQKLGKDESFVLADYFDYIAGNSTGAIIAAALALGWKASDVRDLYVNHGQEMFDKDWYIRQKTYGTYMGKGLTTLLQQKFSADQKGNDLYTLGSAPFKSLLMVVMRNATTDSPWPVSNNPSAKYNDTTRADCNLNLPLWKLVRASTAAPTYFPPESVQLGKNEFVFVDGGVTVYNNPAFHLFCMATADCYRLGWKTGEEDMLLVSVGTGVAPGADPRLNPADMNMLYNATHIPSALMAAANAQQDFLCRLFGRCLRGAEIDREMGALTYPYDATTATNPYGGYGPVGDKKLFTYIRYNVDLTQDGLNALGLSAIPATSVQAMDSVQSIPSLQVIGDTAGLKEVDINDYKNFV